MISAILLVGVIILWVLHNQLVLRVKSLEKELAELREGWAPARPAPTPVEVGIERLARATPAPAPRDLSWLDRSPPPPPDPEEGEPEPAPAPASLGGLFESLVGGRLLIWVGGIALAVAGIFLVRYSIEIGLITPPVRMIMAALFGFLLLAAGEFARSRPDGVIDPRAGQALVGAGILVLYATPYGSLVLYQLISMTTASLLMVMVTAVALILSLRHGAPAAVLGLLGGFATPLLVGERTETLLPLLSYLALLNIALFVIAGRRGWTWLAAAAVAISFLWTGAFLFEPPGDALAAGLFVLALAVAGSIAKAGAGWHLDFIRPAAIGLLQLAVLVARADLGVEAWLLFATLSVACFFLAPRRKEYRWLPALALALALVLLGGKALLWAEPHLPEVAAAITLLFAGGSIAGMGRRSNRWLATHVATAAFLGPVLILRLARPELLERPLWGALLLLIAIGPLFLAWLRRRETEGAEADMPLFAAAGAAMILAGIAAWDLLPYALVGSAWLLAALAVAEAARRLDERGLSALAWVAAGVAVLRNAVLVPQLWTAAAASLFGDPAIATHLPGAGLALQLLALPLPLLGLLWLRLPAHYPQLRFAPLAVAGLFAVAALYVLFKQLYGLADGTDFVMRGFGERILITQFLFAAGWLVCSGRIAVPHLEEADRRSLGTALTALAAARLFWFDMVVHNPALSDQWVGSWPVLNLLLPAYLLSAFWLYKVRRGAPNAARSGLWLTLFLAALIIGVMLMVRQLFQGPILAAPGISEGESYGHSLAGLLLSMALLWAGIRLPDKALRVAGLALLTATTFKVFLSDASALQGVLRILSFLMLGGFLIGIGKLYSKVLAAEARPKDSARA